jgi:hypothetical protein
MEGTKRILYLFFVCGWLLPKINVGPYNLGFQEVISVLILFCDYRIERRLLSVFTADLVFALFLFFFGVFYLSIGNDIEGILIGCRTLLFVFVSLGMTSLSSMSLLRLLKGVMFVIFFFIFFSVARILLNFYFNSFDLINFFYGSDSYRIRAPFENGGASTQVPMGYMLSLLLSIPVVMLTRLKMITFITGALGTTSRASLLSIVFIYIRRSNFKKFSSVLVILFLIILVLALYMKSFSQGDGELDGSANKRLELYSGSLNLLLDSPKAFFLGFGISNTSLAAATGEGFYESFVINSLMQGGMLMFFSSIWILIKTVYYDYKYNLYSVSIAVIVGNLVGGSNYFSMFAYPLMVLIISFAFKHSLLEHD